MHWRIWLELYEGDKRIGRRVWQRRYIYKGNAIQMARTMFAEPRVNRYTGKTYTYKWTISTTNPWVKTEGE